jgi:hypothetical protein
MSLTSRLADYVIAPMMQRSPGDDDGQRAHQVLHREPDPAAYGQYVPRLSDPPAGSDLTEEWQFFLGLAKRMELDLWFVNFFGGGGGQFKESPPVVINMNGDTSLTTEELLPKCARRRGFRCRRWPPIRTGTSSTSTRWSPNATPTALPDSMSATPSVGELAQVLDQVGTGVDAAFPFRLIPRRHGSFMNSSGTNLPALNRGKPTTRRICTRTPWLRGPAIGRPRHRHLTA